MKKEGQIIQFMALIEVMMQDHVVLYHAREREDATMVAEKEERISQARETMRRLLEQILI